MVVSVNPFKAGDVVSSSLVGGSESVISDRNVDLVNTKGDENITITKW